MANHVNSYCRVEANEDGLKVFQQIMDRVKRDPEKYEKSLGYAFWDNDEEFTYDRMIEEVGAKWAYTTDIEEDSVAIYSAWNYVERFFEYVAKQVGDADPGSYLVVNYEDEMPNFVGVTVFDIGGIYDNVELDGDDVHEYIRNVDAEIAAEYNHETEDYSELGWEYLNESMWEHIQTWQTTTVKQMIMGMLGDDYIDKL